MLLPILREKVVRNMAEERKRNVKKRLAVANLQAYIMEGLDTMRSGSINVPHSPKTQKVFEAMDIPVSPADKIIGYRTAVEIRHESGDIERTTVYFDGTKKIRFRDDGSDIIGKTLKAEDRARRDAIEFHPGEYRV